jgi:hypothetical protein
MKIDRDIKKKSRNKSIAGLSFDCYMNKTRVT